MAATPTVEERIAVALKELEDKKRGLEQAIKAQECKLKDLRETVRLEEVKTQDAVNKAKADCAAHCQKLEGQLDPLKAQLKGLQGQVQAEEAKVKVAEGKYNGLVTGKQAELVELDRQIGRKQKALKDVETKAAAFKAAAATLEG
jgi:chromosome segregation ATPase